MGFRINLFEKEPTRGIICSICMGVFEDPVKDSCGHFFCSNCLNPWLQKTGQCPITNNPITIKPDEYLAYQINNLKIKCVECKKNYVRLDQRAEGCNDCSVRRFVNRTAASDSFDRRFNPSQYHQHHQQQQQQNEKESSWKNDLLKWGAIAGIVGTAAVAMSSASKSKATNRK